MQLKQNKVMKALASFEQDNFLEHMPDGEINVSQEGISDVFASIGQAWTNWRMARINKRPKLSQKDLERISTWGYSVRRQIRKTYAEPRWVSQKMNTDITEIPFEEYSTVFKMVGSKEPATFSNVFDSTIAATKDIFELHEYIEKYIGMLVKDIHDGHSARQIYDSIKRTVGLIGSPTQLIEKRLASLPVLPLNKETKLIEDRRGSVFSIVDSKEPVTPVESLPVMEQREYVGFATRLTAVVTALTENKYFEEEMYFTPEFFAEVMFFEHNGQTYADSWAVDVYNQVKQIAFKERNQEVIEALSPDFWNLAVSDISSEMAALNLDVLSAGVAYLNRHLK